MYNFFFFCNVWWPWLNFWSDLIFLQILLIYTLYLLFSSINIYYTLLYMFIEIFFFGFFVSIYQMELFTGFLWVIEFTIIFISILLLFYLNVEGNQLKIKFKIFKIFYFLGLFLTFILFYNSFYIVEFETYSTLIFNIYDYCDDFYESLYNINSNDFTMLTISYYSLNNIEFILIGTLLFISSIVCVNLNKFQKLLKIQKYSFSFNIFYFFKTFTNYTFMRKQNFVNQSINIVNIRLFKKKKKLNDI